MSKLKIGVIAVGYQSPYICSAFAAWLSLRGGTINEHTGEIKETHPDLDIKIVTCSALFKQYAEQGFTYENNDNESYLNHLKLKGLIDECFFIKKPIVDFESRNICLEYLKKFDLDLIWQLDFGDEIYSTIDILNAIRYIKFNNFCDWYRINFKNYVFDYNHFILDFTPPRVHWFNRNGGIDKFVWDNDLIYKNGLHSNQVSNCVIPSSQALVTHYSWCGSPEFLKAKIKFQNNSLGICSYKWNNSSNKLEFNPNYYHNRPYPTVHSIHDNK